MSVYYGGCDVGSTYGKAVILKDGQIAGTATIRSEIDPDVTAKIVLEKAIEQVEGLKDISGLNYLIGTGYGRNHIPFANENVSEISCHAYGVFSLDPSIKTIVDIGGQDVKGIAIGDDGSVKEFVMNDKCAAGTGRFFEAMARIYDLDIEKFSELSLNAKRAIPITAQCSVFAETEVISMLAKRKDPAEIACGIESSVAKRCFVMLKRVGVRPNVAVTGGCCKNKGLIHELTKIMRMEVTQLSVDPQLMGALGAARLAEAKASGAHKVA